MATVSVSKIMIKDASTTIQRYVLITLKDVCYTGYSSCSEGGSNNYD